jgi:hypothetical protein
MASPQDSLAVRRNRWVSGVPRVKFCQQYFHPATIIQGKVSSFFFQLGPKYDSHYRGPTSMSTPETPVYIIELNTISDPYVR